MDKETDLMATGGAVQGTIVAANAAAALVSGGFAAAALVDSELLLPEAQEATPAAGFYARMFAARSLPLSAAVVVLALLGSTSWLGAFLMFAGVMQAADALIGAD